MNVISIFSPKGGVGKTTISAHLADCLAVKYGKKVLCYDSDPQQALFASAEKGGFAFSVINEFPKEKPDCDFLIVDFRPSGKLSHQEQKVLDISSKIICPVRASRLDLESALKLNQLADESKIIKVLSCFDKRIQDQKMVQKDLAKDYRVISYLSIYARTMNDKKTIYTRQNSSLYGIQRAKNEIEAIVKACI